MKHAFLLLLLACATSLSAQPRPVAGPKLIPVYDWDKDKTLTAFRSQMMELIRARDEKRLFDHLDPDVRFSFGPGVGIQAFKRAWYREPHWEELFTMFYMGGGVLRDNDHFSTPSIYASWPEKFDRFSFNAVLSRNTLLYERNDPKSKAIAILSFDIVKPLGEKGHIRVADGRTGWMDPRLLWSPAGYHIELVRKWGTWKIAAFVSEQR
ncbi:MAG: hypothetical protein JO093_16205 [Acidobacteria bacterium]|nr:hypothetical protein [Acidobacteriota bacterium]MBV9069348.1 hypothetical protein [Acidobacteriota bacterium]MBV9187160.1 hypothetical protein [Acidobacteriota bacterium]